MNIFRFLDFFSKKHRIFFIHIPKTAGSTVIQSLGNSFPISKQAHHIEGVLVDGVLDQTYRKAEFLSGHIPYNYALQAVQGLNRYSFISIVRDPVEHFYSTVSYTREQPRSAIPQSLIEMHGRLGNLPLDEFIKTMTGFEIDFFQNPQSRILSGVYDVSSIDPSSFMATISTYYDLVGTTENLDVFLSRAAVKYNLKNVILNKKLNVTKNKIKRIDESTAAHKIIKDLVSYDILIYEKIKEAGLLENNNSGD
ncbi:hypothetical protein MASR1M60_09920 [Rhodocyclaceae bacterium]